MILDIDPHLIYATQAGCACSLHTASDMPPPHRAARRPTPTGTPPPWSRRLRTHALAVVGPRRTAAAAELAAPGADELARLRRSAAECAAAEAQLAASPPPAAGAALSAAQLAFYRRWGFLRVPAAFSPAEVRRREQQIGGSGGSPA